MVVGVGTSASGLPTQTFTNTTQNTATANTATGASTDSSANQYTAGQQALQGQLGGFMANLLAGGQLPQSFGLPQSVYDAAFHNFNKYQAPMLAAQNGAGSPAINASMEELQLQLAGLAGKNAMSNGLDAFSQAANFAMNPIGVNSAKTNIASGNQIENTTKHTTETGIDWGGLLGGIFGLLPGGGFSVPPSPFGNI